MARRDAPGVLNRAKLMDQGLGNNAGVFTTPNPALTVFSNQITLTDKVQVAVGQGGKGAAAARDVQIGILLGMMVSELGYIQTIADAANPDQAVAILHQGGVLVAGVGLHDKAVLTVMQGPASGSVVLEANGTALLGSDLRRKHFFNWEYTTNGTTFVAVPPTPGVTTTVSGLTPLTTVGFRVSVTSLKGGTGAWSAVVNFLVR